MAARGLGKNLFDKSTVTRGRYISASGVMTADTTSEYSALIPVTVGESYTLSGINRQINTKRIHGYNSSGNWVQQVAALERVAANASYELTCSIPSGIAFVRISHYSVDEYVQFELGSAATDYEPYVNRYLDSTGLPYLLMKIKTWAAATFAPTSHTHTASEAPGSVTGVKGNAESSYRTGNVNITAANVGALGASDNAVSATKLKTARTINVGNYASGTAQSFDGSANITIPVNSLNTTALVEPSIGKSGTKTSLPLVGTLKGNKLALLPADQIIIEKTTDGGATWVDAGISDSTKRSLFLGNNIGASVYLPLKDGVRNVDCGIRITITAMKYNVPEGTTETGKYAYWNSAYVKSTERYGSLTSLYFWVNTINDGVSCKCEVAKGNASTNWITLFNKDTTEALTGWPGGDYISFSNTLLGGETTQVAQYWNWRFTFFTRNSTGGTTLASSYTNQYQTIRRICGYGPNLWTTPNNLAGFDHLYTWDAFQNAQFPSHIYPSANGVGTLGASTLKWAGVYATNFIGALTGNCSGTAANVTGTIAIANGGTGKTTAAEAWTALGGGAIGKKSSLVASDIPSHASTATTYGAASTSNYGHAKLSSATDSSVENLAATPKAVKAAYDLASSASTTAGQALSAAEGGIVFDTTYSIANDTVTFTAHVFSCGDEVTSDYAATDFTWYYRLGTGASTVSLGTGKTKDIALTTLGYGGSVGCTFNDGN